jgi:hypothetical protein
MVRATSHHSYIDGAERRHRALVLADLVLSPLTLDGHQPSPVTEQRHTPFGELVQRSHRPRDDRVHLPHLLSYGLVLGSSPHDRDLEIEVAYHFAQKIAAAEKWFDERQPEVGPGQRQRYPGQARSTTDVGNLVAGIEQLGHGSTIQYVPIPYSVHFPGTK